MSLGTMMRMLRVAMELDNRRLYLTKYVDWGKTKDPSLTEEKDES